MKIVYNDRKARLNWGARSTGKALYQILNQIHTIEGEFDNCPLYVPSKLEIFERRLLTISKYFYFLLKIIKPILRYTRFGCPRKVLFNNVEATAAAIQNYRHIDNYLDEILKSISDADALVINGEGSMIFGNPTRIELFFYFALIKIAKEQGKKTFYINAMASSSTAGSVNLSEFNNIIKNVEYCDSVIVRDKYSYSYLESHISKNKLSYVPDTLFTWRKFIRRGLEKPNLGDSIIPFPDDVKDYGLYDFNQPYICIAGSSYLFANGLNSSDFIIEAFTNLVKKIKLLGVKIYLVETCSTDIFLHKVSKITETPLIPSKINLLQAIAILANAEIFITGRYHPAIMASLGGTPCIFLDSNSHKTLSLQQLLEYESPRIYSSFLSNEEIESIYQECISLIQADNKVENRIKIQNTVDKLEQEAMKIIEKII